MRDRDYRLNLSMQANRFTHIHICRRKYLKDFYYIFPIYTWPTYKSFHLDICVHLHI